MMQIAFDFTVTMGVIVTLTIAVFGWVRSIRKAIDDRADGMSARLDRHEHRISANEQTVTGLPAKDDLHELRLALEGLRGDMKEVRAGQASAAAITARQETVIQRVEQYLLSEARK